jgi:very-short-patch-repair endonuclease
MYYTPNIFKPIKRKSEFAAKLRRSPTPAESLVWRHIQELSRGPSYRPAPQWRRQVVILGWIVDFYNDEKLIAIEIDGSTHNADADAKRDAAMKRYGIRTIRYTNQRVYDDLPSVIREIEIMSAV